MTSDYGIRHKPLFGTMHTRPAPGKRAAYPSDLLPREGTGDYRRPVAMLSGKGVIADVPGDHRSQYPNKPRKYMARRNGLPEGRPYVWREPRAGWAARVAARNLDLEAIARADAVIR